MSRSTGRKGRRGGKQHCYLLVIFSYFYVEHVISQFWKADIELRGLLIRPAAAILVFLFLGKRIINKDKKPEVRKVIINTYNTIKLIKRHEKRTGRKSCKPQKYNGKPLGDYVELHCKETAPSKHKGGVFSCSKNHSFNSVFPSAQGWRERRRQHPLKKIRIIVFILSQDWNMWKENTSHCGLRLDLNKAYSCFVFFNLVLKLK